MGGYLINFSVYTLAMLGIICFALFIFKSVMGGGSFSKRNSSLSIEDMMKLSPRKTLYVVKVNGQKFLIASDTDRTTLISKLEDTAVEKISREDKSEELNSYDGIESLDDFASIIDFKKGRSEKKPMMREIARKLNF